MTYVHNHAPKWSAEQKVKLEFIRKIGQSDTNDENLIFFKPSDLTTDSLGNVFVLDAGNFRIQKFTSGWEYMGTFGRRGQGPGEFQSMNSMAVDPVGNMYVIDTLQSRVKVISPAGKELRNIDAEKIYGDILFLESGDIASAKSFPAMQSIRSTSLVHIVDQKGHLIKELGKIEPYVNVDSYRYFNRISFTKDRKDNIYLAYGTRNKIEKYTSSGDLLRVIDRPINYEISREVKRVEKEISGRKIAIPQVNHVSLSIAVDAKERIWVLTYDRQLTFEEIPLQIVFKNEAGRVDATRALKTSKSPGIDAFVFHVFNNEGQFLGKIPLKHFGGTVKIFRGRLYILEKRAMCIYEYKIVEDTGPNNS